MRAYVLKCAVWELLAYIHMVAIRNSCVRRAYVLKCAVWELLAYISTYVHTAYDAVWELLHSSCLHTLYIPACVCKMFGTGFFAYAHPIFYLRYSSVIGLGLQTSNLRVPRYSVRACCHLFCVSTSKYVT